MKFTERNQVIYQNHSEHTEQYNTSTSDFFGESAVAHPADNL